MCTGDIETEEPEQECDKPTELDVNWEYAANVQNPLPAVSSSASHSSTEQCENLMQPVPSSLVSIDADGYVLRNESGQWLGILVV